jgi:hypothetical protein
MGKPCISLHRYTERYWVAAYILWAPTPSCPLSAWREDGRVDWRLDLLPPNSAVAFEYEAGCTWSSGRSGNVAGAFLTVGDLVPGPPDLPNSAAMPTAAFSESTVAASRLPGFPELSFCRWQ